MFVQVIVKQHQDLIGGDVAAVAVDDAQAVAIPVKGDAQVIAPGGYLVTEFPQTHFAGRGHMAAKVRVPLKVDVVNRAARRIQQYHQGVRAGAVHRVKQNAQPFFADEVHLDAALDAVDKVIEGVLRIGDQALFFRQGEGHAFRVSVAFFYEGGQLFQTCRNFLRCIPAALHDQFDAVVGGRVVAGGDLDAVKQAFGFNRIHDKGRGRRALHEPDGDPVGAQGLSDPARRVKREETPVKPDHDGHVLFVVPYDHVGQALRHQTNVVIGEILADDPSPAACSKCDHIISCAEVFRSFSIPRTKIDTQARSASAATLACAGMRKGKIEPGEPYPGSYKEAAGRRREGL